MKLRIAIAVLLALLIAEFGWLAYSLEGEYAAAVAQAELEQAQLERRTEEIEEKEERLNNLQSDELLAYENEAARLNEDIAAIGQSREDILAQTGELQATLEGKQEEFAEVEEDYSYYEEVCRALQEGIEKVKGYMAGN